MEIIWGLIAIIVGALLNNKANKENDKTLKVIGIVIIVTGIILLLFWPLFFIVLASMSDVF